MINIENIKQLLNKGIFKEPSIYAIIGDPNSGKSMLVYNLIEELKKEYTFSLVTYGLRNEIKESKEIHSINELEQIKNSIIFMDEFFTLFDLEDRKKRNQIENSLRLIYHNNNILVLVGLPENFKKFISAKVNVIFYKAVNFFDFINGSNVKRLILDYNGLERGSTLLNIGKDEVIVYDGSYRKYQNEYLKQYDTKLNNVPIFVEKKSSENVQDNKSKDEVTT